MFDILLTKAEITKAELARDLNITPASISKWKNSPPQYAIAYLKLRIELKKYRNLKKLLKVFKSVVEEID